MHILGRFNLYCLYFSRWELYLWQYPFILNKEILQLWALHYILHQIFESGQRIQRILTICQVCKPRATANGYSKSCFIQLYVFHIYWIIKFLPLGLLESIETENWQQHFLPSAKMDIFIRWHLKWVLSRQFSIQSTLIRI